jgi:hypothetical protein
VHSRYQRRLADLPVADQLVELCLAVRHFFCVHTVCEPLASPAVMADVRRMLGLVTVGTSRLPRAAR